MSQALTSINPDHSLWLAETFARNRAMYGGHVMVEGDGADPAAPPADPAAPPADPAAPPADPADDPANLDDPDPRVQRANREAARYRTELRTAQAQLTEVQAAQQENAAVLQALRTALTGEGGEETDPATALAALTGETEGLRSENGQLRAGLLVHELAAENNANPVALLDSRRFTDTLNALDASADDYRTQVADAITAAVTANATLAAVGQGPTRGGADGAGSGSQVPGNVTQEQFDAMAYKDRVALNRTNPALYRRLAGSGD